MKNRYTDKTYVPLPTIDGADLSALTKHPSEPPTDVLVTIDYTKGGPNYFSGGHIRRGYYVRVTPVRCHDGCVSFMLGDGCAWLVLEAKAANAKHFEAIVAKVKPKAREIATAYAQGQKDAIRSLIAA